MCGDTRIPRDTCAGHTIPRETRIPATVAFQCNLQLWSKVTTGEREREIRQPCYRNSGTQSWIPFCSWSREEYKYLYIMSSLYSNIFVRY